jgi:hypothetical protein
MRIIVFIIIFFLSHSFRIYAQTSVEWASEVLDCSQNYDTDDFADVQLLGEPDIYNTRPRGSTLSFLFGWIVETDSETEMDAYIKVGFSNPQKANRVVVAENYNPGSITQIYIYDALGNEQKVYDEDLEPTNAPKRLFQVNFPYTHYEVAAVKVVGKPGKVDGWNALD